MITDHYQLDAHPFNDNLIVLIHGLGGDFIKTWKEFRKLLFEDGDLKHCDILSWGYPSKFSLWHKIPKIGRLFANQMPEIELVALSLITELKEGISEKNYENIVLVGHSLGGIVVQKMIIECIEDSNHHEFLKKIKFIILIATPTEGTQVENILKIYPHIKVLDLGNDKLVDIKGKFVKYIYKANPGDSIEDKKFCIPIRVIAGIKDQFVPSHMVKSVFDNCEEVSADHFSIVRCSDKEHKTYVTVKNIITGLGFPNIYLKKTFEIFDPKDDKNLEKWKGFKNTYYAWHPTWNYEKYYGGGYGSKLLEIHKQRLIDHNLIKIVYILPAGEDDPLLCSFCETENFFKRLKREYNTEYDQGHSKYEFYVWKKLVTDKVFRSVLSHGTSFFIGNKNRGSELLLFINSPPFISEEGIHREAYWTNNPNVITPFKEHINKCIYVCTQEHTNGNHSIYKLDDNCNLIPKLNN